MKIALLFTLLVAAAVALGGCDGTEEADAGTDAGQVAADAGPPARDAGERDAGAGLDAGPRPDGGPPDGGPPPPEPPVPEVVCDTVATNEASLTAAIAAATPGTTVCLEAREWPDLTLVARATGTAEAPILIAAERPGETFLTGDIAVQLGGQHVIVTGLVLRQGRSAGSHLIDFEAGGEECRGCRLSNVAVIELADTGDTKWVSLRGEDNRVDHCAFYGKTNDGALLVVWRPDGGPDRHRIDHNLFAERPSLGRNGGETIRVGDSSQHDSDSFTVVEENYFYRSDGEIEIVSNKSGANVYRRNVFFESQGLLTLRHGDGCTVERNVFIANGVNGGGVRIVGSGHRVVNNYVEGCRTSSNVRGGIVLMAADASPAMNGYQPVQDVEILHNTIVDCQQSLLVGGGSGTVAPTRVTLHGNLFDTRGQGDVIREETALTSSVVSDNLFFGGALGITDATGFTMANPLMVRGGGGIWRIPFGSPARDGAASGFGVTIDLDEDARDGTPDIGADEAGVGPARLPVTRRSVGPTFDAEALRP